MPIFVAILDIGDLKSRVDPKGVIPESAYQYFIESILKSKLGLNVLDRSALFKEIIPHLRELERLTRDAQLRWERQIPFTLIRQASSSPCHIQILNDVVEIHVLGDEAQL